MTALRVCMIGAFDADYPRNQIIRIGLEKAGIQVDSVHIPTNKNTLRKLPYVFAARSHIRQCDVVFIPAFNALLAPFIWAFARLWRKPVLIDYMVGLTDSISDERGEGTRLEQRLYRLIDQFNVTRMPTLTDTAAHVRYFEQTLHRQMKCMSVLPVGVNETWFHEYPESAREQPKLVQFFGSYIPFHGVETIIEASAHFNDRTDVQFELIGHGKQYYETCVQQAQALKLTNLKFIDRVAPELLAARIANATICLGVFGDRAKTDYVIPNKVFQCMAIGRPVITAESQALREVFVPGEDCITVPPGNSEQLALAIEKLLDSPAECLRIGQTGADKIRKLFSPEHIGAQLKSILLSLA